MTRRDYVMMTQALATGMPSPAEHARAFIDGYCRAVHVLAEGLFTDNPRFERDRFLMDTGCFPIPSKSSGQ
jgi:hypothetical protein